MVSNDYYAILRVRPDADGDAVRSAYRKLMRRYHPDVNRSDEAAARAKAINEAYACLRDTGKRAHYDRIRRPRRPASATPARKPAPADHWQPNRRPTPGVEHQPFRFEPSWAKAALVGFATLATLLTFAMTSATPPADPPSHRVRIVPAQAPAEVSVETIPAR